LQQKQTSNFLTTQHFHLKIGLLSESPHLQQESSRFAPIQNSKFKIQEN
jgi:hypothetical protein